ncbi:MAG: alpha-amylase, partial [Butyrivibrio sp.]|nr:alpha-amylase [Butyrivibrio sp.]
VPGTGYYYEARFWSGMPDLNLDSSALRDELKDITQFWTDHGVDGFRLDACTYFYTGDDLKNVEFLTWLNDTVKAQNPDAYIVGEAWTSSATYNKYYESGVDSFFDFDYAGSEGIIAGVARGTTPASRYGEALEKTQETLLAANENAIDAPFYTNHDMARSSGYFTGKNASDKLKLSAALNLLMPGNAFVYYGEELGMKGSGKDENKRAPMYWTAGAATSNANLSVPSWLENPESGMCKGPKDMDDVKMKYPSLDEQYQDPYSIYNYYKMAIRLRNTYPCIARGTTAVATDLSDSDICAFMRTMDSDVTGNNAVNSDGTSPTDVMIVINTSDEVKEVSLSGQVAAGKGADTNGTSGDTFELAEYSNLSYQLNTSEQVSTLSDGKLSIAPFGVSVLTK